MLCGLGAQPVCDAARPPVAKAAPEVANPSRQHAGSITHAQRNDLLHIRSMSTLLPDLKSGAPSSEARQQLAFGKNTGTVWGWGSGDPDTAGGANALNNRDNPGTLLAEGESEGMSDTESGEELEAWDWKGTQQPRAPPPSFETPHPTGFAGSAPASFSGWDFEASDTGNQAQPNSRNAPLPATGTESSGMQVSWAGAESEADASPAAGLGWLQESSGSQSVRTSSPATSWSDPAAKALQHAGPRRLPARDHAPWPQQAGGSVGEDHTPSGWFEAAGPGWLSEGHSDREADGDAGRSPAGELPPKGVAGGGTGPGASRVPSWRDLSDLFEEAEAQRLARMESRAAALGGGSSTAAAGAGRMEQFRVPVVERSLSAPSREEMQREVELEQEAIRSSIEDAQAVQESVVRLERGMELGPMRSLEQEWLTAIVDAVDKEQAALLETGSAGPSGSAGGGKGKGRRGALEEAAHSAQTSAQTSSVGQTVGPYLLLLPPEKLSVIALHTTLNLLLAKGGTVPATSVMSRIGTMVEAEVNVSRLEGRDRRAWERMQGTMDSRKLVSLRQRCRAALDDADWPVTIKAKLGAALLKCVVDTASVRIPASAIDRARIEWFAANTAGSTRPFVSFAGLAGHVRLSDAVDRTLQSLPPSDQRRLGLSVDADAAAATGLAAEAAGGLGSPLARLEQLDRQRLERIAAEGSRDDSTMFPGMIADDAAAANTLRRPSAPASSRTGVDKSMMADAESVGRGWGVVVAATDDVLDPASTSESEQERVGEGGPRGLAEAEPVSLRAEALWADSGPESSTVSTRLPKALEQAASRGLSGDEVALPTGGEESMAPARPAEAATTAFLGGGVSLGAMAHAARFVRYEMSESSTRLLSDSGDGAEEAGGYSAEWMRKMFPLPSASELRVMDALRYPGRYLADGGMLLSKPDNVGVGQSPGNGGAELHAAALDSLHLDDDDEDEENNNDNDDEHAEAAEVAHASDAEEDEDWAPPMAGAPAHEADHDASAPADSRVEMPALVHSYAWAPKRGSTGVKAAVGVIRLHPHVLGMLREAGPSPNKQLFYPMVVPPRPWKRAEGGGYVVQRARLMRTKGSRLQTRVLRDATMPGTFEALNVLGGVAWRMNAAVRDVVREVWQNGGGIADIPSRTDHVPPIPPNLDAIEDEEERREQYRSWRRMNTRVEQWNRDLHGLRCDHLLKMEVADKFRGDIVYFPHNLDFRGRVYPVPPHLNHMGADICRGLLLFAERRPLGEAGLRWLKVHLANKMGMDKVAFAEREAFVDDNMAEILDSVDHPLTGNGWWLGADSPWQALATCQDLAAAMRSADPRAHMSSVPVHQDGTCNGLQHYAALGRDYQGAAAVNLVAADKPQDVYSAVLDLVLQRIDEDAALPETPAPGTPADELSEYESRRRCAAFVHGSVVRKTIKQTVMTSVYGVTFIGARDQIRNRLRETFEPRRVELGLTPDELDDLVYKSSSYLARTTLDSLGQMFEAADSIKSWLTQAARLVATTNQPMAWVTPLGLPVVQPYRRNASQVVSTVMQQVVLASENDALPVSSQKQGSAFPPNYVHSLDSTHMMMTAIASARRGMVFTAVHDSYWTHASDVDEMNVLLRDAFVNLYEMPLLEELRASLVLRFPGLSFPDLPQRGTLDLDLVRSSPYFFN